MGGGATGGEIDGGLGDDVTYRDAAAAVSGETSNMDDEAAALASPSAFAFDRMPRASAK